MTVRATFAQLCRDTRTRLRMTQAQLGAKVGVSRGYVAKIEAGHANPSLAIVERVALALGLEIELVARTPVVLGNLQRDLVQARCSGHVDGRLHRAGWLTAREVEVVRERSHGWIDLVAFDPRTGILLVVEIKTRLDDLGAIERQLGWYERSAFEVARRMGWRPRRIVAWLLSLASEEVEDSVRSNRIVMVRAFPTRAREMSLLLAGDAGPNQGWGAALIDPHSKRRAWLMPHRIDGRRSPAPYADYGDAARRFAR